MADRNITVQVDFYGGLQEVFGAQSTRVVLSGSRSVGAVLEALATTGTRRDIIFASPGVLQRDLTVLKNGRNIVFIGGLGVELSEEDVLAVFPPTFGG
jgi:molybdopterin converting factor small subunit